MKKQNNGSLVIKVLIALGVFALACLALGIVLDFGWIAGVVWILVFRKKLNTNPIKQKNWTIAVSVLSALSFIFMIYSFVNHSESSMDNLAVNPTISQNHTAEKTIDTPEETLGAVLTDEPVSETVSDDVVDHEEIEISEDPEASTDNDYDIAVYDHLKALLDSEENPSNYVEIPGIPLEADPSENQYAEALEKWYDDCEKYEDNAIQKTAETFKISKDDVEDIFYHYVSTDYSQSEKIEKESVAENYDTQIVVASKSVLERFISGYKIPLATQLWTVVDFDEDGAVMAIADITEKSTGISQTARIVLTPEIKNGTVNSCLPHYVSVGNDIYINDGYCDEIFGNLEDAFDNLGR